MRAKTVLPTFQDFYDAAPEEIKRYVDRCGDTPQSKAWHPEGDVKKHTEIVFARARNTGDPDLVLAAFLHDLGKADTTTKDPVRPDVYHATYHDVVSTKLAEKHREWILSMGGDPEKVLYLVSQHMRAKDYGKMRPAKQEAMRRHEHFGLLQKFTKLDGMVGPKA